MTGAVVVVFLVFGVVVACSGVPVVSRGAWLDAKGEATAERWVITGKMLIVGGIVVAGIPALVNAVGWMVSQLG